MFRLGIIEESLKHEKALELIKPYFFSQRIENIQENGYPSIWHINEYHVQDEKMKELLDYLKEEVKPTWYIHAFNDSQLYVILSGKFFVISLQRDNTWNEMIEYGVRIANVERHFLESVPLNV
jgi:hypothetical protein